MCFSVSHGFSQVGGPQEQEEVRVGQPLLEVRNLCKSYPGVQALNDVSLYADKGQVVGLVGENGAGKSTILNLICGTQAADSGEVFVGGNKVGFGSYHEANLGGVFRIFQELALVPNIAVYENLFLSHEAHFSRYQLVSHKRRIDRARELLAEFGHSHIDPTKSTDAYDFSSRQVLEIIKAFALAEVLGIETPIILLDEPTAGLAGEEIDFLKAMVQELKHRAVMVFVSHRLTEVLEWSDRIYVLKDGQVAAEINDVAHLSEGDLHKAMVGRVREEQFYREQRQRTELGEPVLQVSGLTSAPYFQDVSFTVSEGEILGFAGVLGSGKSHIGRAIFGAANVSDGEVILRGETIKHPTIDQMTKRGVGWVPPDRHDEGLFLSFSVCWNISFARLACPAKSSSFLHLGFEQKQAREFVARMRVKTPSIWTQVDSLSGGNQQKVVLARWLALGVNCLILDNPTRGVDAGAKEEIYDLIRELTDRGVAIVLISDDLLELIGLSNRVIVMKDGLLVSENATPPDNKPTEAEQVQAMV